MAVSPNPYEAVKDPQPQPHASNETLRWPMRLTVAIIGFPLLVLLASGQVAMSRSTSLHDRTIGALESLVWLIPGLILIPALAVSAWRVPNGSRKSRVVAAMIAVVGLVFAAWVCRELLRGPIRGF